MILRACRRCLKLESSIFPIFSKAIRNCRPSVILSFRSFEMMPLYRDLSILTSLVVIWSPMILNNSWRLMLSSVVFIFPFSGEVAITADPPGGVSRCCRTPHRSTVSRAPDINCFWGNLHKIFSILHRFDKFFRSHSICHCFSSVSSSFC